MASPVRLVPVAARVACAGVALADDCTVSRVPLLLAAVGVLLVTLTPASEMVATVSATEKSVAGLFCPLEAEPSAQVGADVASQL